MFTRENDHPKNGTEKNRKILPLKAINQVLESRGFSPTFSLDSLLRENLFEFVHLSLINLMIFLMNTPWSCGHKSRSFAKDSIGGPRNKFLVKSIIPWDASPLGSTAD